MWTWQVQNWGAKENDNGTPSNEDTPRRCHHSDRLAPWNVGEEKVGTLKDVLPNRSRWADIEVEDADELGGDSGRGDEKLAGRRQLGPRGGRRPKFPAEAQKALSRSRHPAGGRCIPSQPRRREREP